MASYTADKNETLPKSSAASPVNLDYLAITSAPVASDEEKTLALTAKAASVILDEASHPFASIINRRKQLFWTPMRHKP